MNFLYLVLYVFTMNHILRCNRSIFFAFIFCITCNAIAQKKVPIPQAKNAGIFEIKDFKTGSILLQNGWRFMRGDDPAFSNPFYNDNDWRFIDPTRNIEQYRHLSADSVFWLRLTIVIDSSILSDALVMHISQNAASEIFLDGKRLAVYGRISNDPPKIVAYNPLDQPLPIPFSSNAKHVLAVRICLPRSTTNFHYPGLNNNFFQAYITKWEQNKQLVDRSFYNSFGISILKAGMFTFLLLLHFAFFWFYRKQKVNLYLGIFDLFSALAYIIYGLLVFRIHDVALGNLLRIPGTLFFTVGSWFLIPATYSVLNYKKEFMYYFFMTLLFVVVAFYFTPWNRNIEKTVSPQIFIYPILVTLETLRLSFLSLRRKREGYLNPISTVMIVCLLSVGASIIAFQDIDFNSEKVNHFFSIFINIAILGLPISFFMYVALEFGFYYRRLLKAQALRNRIALDLHDDLGTKLSTARIFLANVHDTNEQNDASLLNNAIHLLDTSINDLRQIMNELQTSSLMEKGYIAATEELINKINHLQQITFTLSNNGINKRLEQRTDYNLFRITQELINNTLKYAQAKNVTIDVVSRDEKIILMYEDDGVGCNITSNRQGYGLSNIASRTQALGGSVEFDSKPGAGFRTIIEVPLMYA